MLVVANYKMNLGRQFYLKANKVFNKFRSEDTNVILCPPFVYLSCFKPKHFNLGAQNLCGEINKKSTGQISPAMLKEFKVNYVILGHSECRQMGETNDLISKKVGIAINNDITPIVCVGSVAKSLQKQKEEVLIQLKSALANVKAEDKFIVAYEPVWAIGSGVTPSVKQINAVNKSIRAYLKENNLTSIILYGGSVNKTNINEFKTADLDGFLVGTASLDLDEFLTILKEV